MLVGKENALCAETDHGKDIINLEVPGIPVWASQLYE